jgi:hypothetical protein
MSLFSVYYTVIIYAQLDFNQDWGFPRRYFLIFLFFIKPFPTVVVYLKFLIRITKKISCLLSKGSTVSEKNILCFRENDITDADSNTTLSNCRPWQYTDPPNASNLARYGDGQCQ